MNKNTVSYVYNVEVLFIVIRVAPVVLLVQDVFQMLLVLVLLHERRAPGSAATSAVLLVPAFPSGQSVTVTLVSAAV